MHPCAHAAHALSLVRPMRPSAACAHAGKIVDFVDVKGQPLKGEQLFEVSSQKPSRSSEELRSMGIL